MSEYGLTAGAKALINTGLRRPRPCTGRYMNGKPRTRCLWRYSNPQQGHTYAVRHTSALHRWGVCLECSQIVSEHYDYKGLLPTKSYTYRRYWTPAEWNTFAHAMYKWHMANNKGGVPRG